jgi:hypothetical protein
MHYAAEKMRERFRQSFYFEYNPVFQAHEKMNREERSLSFPAKRPFLFLLLTLKYSCMTIETEAVKSVAGLMALSARTAPKAVGLDSIKTGVLTGKDQDKLANQMIRQGKAMNIDFFRISGERGKGK